MAGKTKSDQSDNPAFQGAANDKKSAHTHVAGRSDARASLALKAGKMGSWCWDIKAGTVTGDTFVADLFNIDFDAQPWPEDTMFASIHPDDLPMVQMEVDRAFKKTDEFEAEFRDRVIDPVTGKEGVRWLGGRGSITARDATGNPLEMIGVNWDATEQKNHEKHLKMLAREMNHRVNNAFAVIRALIHAGARLPGDKSSFSQTLAAQVQAMADTHRLLAELAWEIEGPAMLPIRQILEQALEPWLADGVAENVVAITYEDELLLTSDQVSAVAMLVYELTTNAMKYGALGRAGGGISISVSKNDNSTATLRWRETLERQLLRTEDVEHGGFGETLIDHCVTRLGAKMDRELKPEGLYFELTMQL